MWTLVLAPDPHLAPTGRIDLGQGEEHHGIAAITDDHRILIVGITRLDDMARFGARTTAGRLAAFDLEAGQELWRAASPVAVESLTAAPDGLVYGYRSDPGMSGGDLIAIDTVGGVVQVISTDLSTPSGRLLVMPAQRG